MEITEASQLSPSDYLMMRLIGTVVLKENEIRLPWDQRVKPVVKRLARKGLIEYSLPSDGDYRVVISATDLGREIALSEDYLVNREWVTHTARFVPDPLAVLGIRLRDQYGLHS